MRRIGTKSAGARRIGGAITGLLFSCAILVLASCASEPMVVPEGLSASELTQRAQEASEKKDWDRSLAFYQAVLARYSDNLSAVCAAEYEIAFVYYKEQQWDQAKEGFKTLLARYSGEDALLLPAQYKILAEKILAKIELEKH